VGTGFARPGYDGGLNNIESRFGGSVPQSGQGGYGSGQGGYAPSLQGEQIGYSGGPRFQSGIREFGESVPKNGQGGYGGGLSLKGGLGGYGGSVPQSVQRGYGGEFGQAKHDLYHHVHDKHCDHHNHGHY